MGNEIIQAENLNAFEWKVAELLASGKTRKEVATELGIGLSEVYTIANRKKVKTQTAKLTSELATDIVSKHVRLLDAMIESKLEKLEDSDMDLADATKKDIVDLIETSQKIAASAKQAESKQEENSYVNILQQILIVNKDKSDNDDNGIIEGEIDTIPLDEGSDNG